MNVFSQWGLYCLCRFCNTRRASLSFLTPKKKMTVWIELASKLMSCWPAFFTFSSSKVFKTSGNSPKIWGRSKPSRTTWHYKVILGHKTAKHLLIDITKHVFLFVIPIWSKRGRTQFISSRERERESNVTESSRDMWIYPKLFLHQLLFIAWNSSEVGFRTGPQTFTQWYQQRIMGYYALLVYALSWSPLQ